MEKRERKINGSIRDERRGGKETEQTEKDGKENRRGREKVKLMHITLK